MSGPPTVPIAEAEKAAYGNEVDFLGLSFDDLAEVGFHVYTTPENVSAGGTTPNMPSIAIEVDPNLDSAPKPQANFSTLTYTPDTTRP